MGVAARVSVSFDRGFECLGVWVFGFRWWVLRVVGRAQSDSACEVVTLENRGGRWRRAIDSCPANKVNTRGPWRHHLHPASVHGAADERRFRVSITIYDGIYLFDLFQQAEIFGYRDMYRPRHRPKSRHWRRLLLSSSQVSIILTSAMSSCSQFPTSRSNTLPMTFPTPPDTP